MMSFSSIILLTAFIAIYSVFYFKTSSEINEKLDFNEELVVNTEGEVSLGSEKSTAIIVNRVFPNLGIYFNLLVDNNGEIFVIDSALELPINIYEKAAYDAWTNNNRKTVRFENRIWRYKIIPVITEIIKDNKISEDNSGETYQIRFLDITESVESLNTLRNTLVLTGIALLSAFFFMSAYFSSRAVKPMQLVWDNQQRFLGDVSHELKTPLSIIIANIGVLYENKQETINSQLKWLGYISTGAERMSGLIQSMLMLSKLETENTFLVKSPVNISKILIEAVNSFEAGASDKNININRQITKDISVNTYSVLIEQIIHILIDNAVRYTPLGGVIDIALYREKTAFILSIQNSGLGISEDDLPKIFDRFFRSSMSRTSKGDSYGLGLSIAKTSIDKIGGKIEVQSIENQKTTFTVKIPF